MMNDATATFWLRAAAAMALCGAAHAAIQPSDDCPSARNRGPATQSQCYAYEFAGVTRTFRLYAPRNQTRSAQTRSAQTRSAQTRSAQTRSAEMPSAPTAPLPLVLVLHGGGGNGEGMEALTQRGFNRIADRDGVIVVYPDGIGKGWNDGRTDLRSKAVAGHVDDLGFLRALPGEIAQRFPVDVRRVYATGISNGGLMSYRLACDAADVFAAVAPVAANISVELAPRCHPSRPISIAIMNGTDDPIMPWNGGAVKVLWATRGTVLSTDATLERWIELNRCERPLHTGALIDADPDDGTSVLLHNSRCADKTEVDLYEIRGGGHTWPGGLPYLGPRLVGKVSHELDANEVLWRFLREKSLP